MKLHSLSPSKGSVKNNSRVGRGQASGGGGTAKRGHKGAKSRSGYSSKRAFEGGQMPLQRRVPKRGFKNINRVDYTAVNLSRLEEIVAKYNVTTITFDVLKQAGVCSKSDKVKVLSEGEISSKFTVEAHKVSAPAKAKLEAAGCTVVEL